MLFALLKKWQNYAIFMLKVIILCPIMLTCAANINNNASVQNNRGIFCRGRCTVVAKVQRGQRTVRPTCSYDQTTGVTDCSGLDMLSRES